MRRAVVLTVSIAAIAALTWAWAAAPKTVAVEKGKAKAAEAPAAPGTATLVDRLFKRTKFAAIPKDKNANLQNVLDKLAKESGVAFEINEPAFLNLNPLEDEAGSPPRARASAKIMAEKGLPARETTLAVRLKQVLARVPSSSGATFMVRRDHIEITSGAQQAAEVLALQFPGPLFGPLGGQVGGGLQIGGGLQGGAQLGGGLAVGGQIGGFGGGLQIGGGLQGGAQLGGGLAVGGQIGGFAGGLQIGFHVGRGQQVPLVHAVLERRPFSEALKVLQGQVKQNIVLDVRAGEKAKAPVSATLLNSPLDSALFVLAEMVELRVVRLDNTFFVTAPEKAKALQDAWQKHEKKMRAVEGPPPGPEAKEEGPAPPGGT